MLQITYLFVPVLLGILYLFWKLIRYELFSKVRSFPVHFSLFVVNCE